MATAQIPQLDAAAAGDQGDGCEIGVYKVVHDNAAVRIGVDLSTPVVAHLRQGDSVLVVEILRSPGERRVRGRIAQPAGWISLLETHVGYRWATPSIVVGHERARLLREIVDYDEKLEGLRERVERLRAEHEACLLNFHERATELEQRVLGARVEPILSAPASDVRGGRGRHSMHLDHDRASIKPILPDYTVPPGAEVISVHKVPLTRAQASRIAVYPPEVRKPEDDEVQAMGNFIASNAVFLPSPNYRAVLDESYTGDCRDVLPTPTPAGVFPVTRPPRQVIGEDHLGGGGDGGRAFAPLPLEYSYDYPGAWRFTATGGCPLTAGHTELVADVYGGGELHPQTLWRSAGGG